MPKPTNWELPDDWKAFMAAVVEQAGPPPPRAKARPEVASLFERAGVRDEECARLEGLLAEPDDAAYEVARLREVLAEISLMVATVVNSEAHSEAEVQLAVSEMQRLTGAYAMIYAPLGWRMGVADATFEASVDRARDNIRGMARLAGLPPRVVEEVVGEFGKAPLAQRPGDRLKQAQRRLD